VIIKSKIKVVIVEDDPVFSALLIKELQNRGVTDIELFDSSVTLLNRENWSPDLFFMDFKMTDISGARASRFIKKRLPSTIVVLISSSRRIENIKKKKFKIDRVVLKDQGVKRMVSIGINALLFDKLKKYFYRASFILIIVALLLFFIFKFI
jgi:CheY-like chemotaxis protein